MDETGGSTFTITAPRACACARAPLAFDDKLDDADILTIAALALAAAVPVSPARHRGRTCIICTRVHVRARAHMHVQNMPTTMHQYQ